MSEEPKQSLSKIRTFAADLQTQRQKRTPSTHSPKQVTHKINESEPITKESASTPQVASVIEPVVKTDHKPKTESPVINNKDQKPVKTHTKIPAFHELQKDIAAVQKKTGEHINANVTKKSSPKKQESKKAIITNVGYDSTIITDTKRNRFRLFPAIQSSLQAWWKNLTRKRKKKAPTYTVPETEHRKGVIQKATSKTGTIFTADSETLKEQIRRRRLQEAEKELSNHEAEINWSPYTETGFNLLEEPESTQPTPTNVTIEYRKPRITQTKQEPIAEVVAVSDKPLTPSAPNEEVETFEPTTDHANVDDLRWSSTAEDMGQKSTTVDASHHTPDTPSIPQTEVEVPETSVDTLPNISEPDKKPRFRSLNTINTNTLTVTVLLLVIGFVVVVTVTNLVIQHLNDKLSERTTKAEIVSVLQDTQVTPIVLTTDTLNQLPKLVIDTASTLTNTPIEIPVISPTGDEVSASYIFDILHFRATPSLKQSINTLRFTTVDESKIAMVLQFVDEDTVRGGLLNWEGTMAEDLSSIFPISIEYTSEKFTDEKVSGIDTRSLPVNDTDVLVYGFINNNILVISLGKSDFTQTAERVLPIK